jgi:hypothetical protein
MIEINDSWDADEQEDLKPSFVSPTHLHRLDEMPEFEPLPGQYHIVEVDSEGNEIQFSDFSCAPSSLQYYSDINKFKVKKNPS